MLMIGGMKIIYQVGQTHLMMKIMIIIIAMSLSFMKNIKNIENIKKFFLLVEKYIIYWQKIIL
jgi:hypothetical protein